MSHQLWSSLVRHRVTPNEIYFIDCCANSIKADLLVDQDLTYTTCIAKGLITSKGELTEKAIKILNEFETYLVKRKKKISNDVLGVNSLERVKEYREAWPAKRLPSGELARQSVKELQDKFIWFFKTYPEYDWDLVLDATDYYNIVYERKQYKFMVTSSYFIKKTNPQTKETTSKLADYCQELLDNPNILDEIR
jgi:hypothetical protein